MLGCVPKLSRTDRKARTIAGRQKSQKEHSKHSRQHDTQETCKGVQTANRAASTKLTSDNTVNILIQLGQCAHIATEYLHTFRSLNCDSQEKQLCSLYIQLYMLLVEAQIMMLHVFVIVHVDDHLPMYWCDAVPKP